MRALELLSALTLRAAQPISDVAKVPSQRDYEEMARKARGRLHAITDSLTVGDIDLREWFERFDSILLDAHTTAYGMGRNLAGDLEDDINDLIRGMEARDAESYYLRGFLDALRGLDERYWDAEAEKWKADAIKSRQDLYIGKVRGTANEAFVEHTPADLDEFYWTLGGTEDHCSECPELADLSPFTKSTLFTYPGAADTPCKFNCLCHLERVDGLSGFKRIDL